MAWALWLGRHDAGLIQATVNRGRELSARLSSNAGEHLDDTACGKSHVAAGSDQYIGAHEERISGGKRLCPVQHTIMQGECDRRRAAGDKAFAVVIFRLSFRHPLDLA